MPCCSSLTSQIHGYKSHRPKTNRNDTSTVAAVTYEPSFTGYGRELRSRAQSPAARAIELTAASRFHRAFGRTVIAKKASGLAPSLRGRELDRANPRPPR